jgi:hypothetical protein
MREQLRGTVWSWGFGWLSGTSVHQGVSEFVYFFAENTKITTKPTMFDKLYFSHAKIDIIHIKKNWTLLYRVSENLEEKNFKII